MKFARPALSFALLLAAALMFTGCTSAWGVRADLTNATDSTARSDDQDRNNYARTIDHNTRGIWDDTARLLLLDRPSRLSPYTIP